MKNSLRLPQARFVLTLSTALAYMVLLHRLSSIPGKLESEGANLYIEAMRLLMGAATRPELSQRQAVLVGILGGRESGIDLGRLLTRRLSITGSTLRARSPREKTDIAMSLREWVWPMLDSGKLKPVIQATFPLSQAAEAHRILEANEAMGKIVLTTGR